MSRFPEPPSPSAARVQRVVAVDGPAGAGKSTVARTLAAELGFHWLDTGATYRAMTWWLQRRGIAASAPGAETPELLAAVEAAPIELEPGRAEVAIDGVWVGSELRSATVESAVSLVAKLACVRDRLRDVQRAFARLGPVVCEGRDMGTVVFPDARWKFYLDASLDERARRRLADFAAQGRDTTLAAVRAEIVARDALDSGRAIAPLRAAADAVRIDTTGRSVAEVVTTLAERVRATDAATDTARRAGRGVR